ncbi:MAG: ABC transporter substrate-binding protein [Nitratireductor sp.]|nr:ABC transporter substrate-binding protein [Nitratireductor sp.]
MNANLKVVLAAGIAAAIAGGPAMADDIKIGFLGGVTGPIESLVPPIIDGAQLAIRHINEQGGLLGGNNAVLVVGDTTCADATKAADAADRLVNVDNVVAIDGALCSGATISAANNAAIPGGVVMISPASTSPAITSMDDKDLVFRTATSDAYQGEVLSRLIASKGVKNVAITYVNNDYGKGLADSLSAAFPKDGGTVAISEAHEDGKADYRAELGALAASGATDLVIIGYADGSGGTILRQALEGGDFTQFFSADGMVSDKIAAELGSQLEGKFTMTKPGTPEIPGAASFKKLAEEAGIKADGVFVPNSYDAAFIIGLAIEKAGSADRAAIAKAIREVALPPGETILPGEWSKAVEAIKAGKDINYEGAVGSNDFDANGDVSTVFLHTEIKDGKVAELGIAE